jgi:hypothetical protein
MGTKSEGATAISTGPSKLCSLDVRHVMALTRCRNQDPHT